MLYCPNSCGVRATTEDFDEQLHAVQKILPKDGIMIILGDLNARDCYDGAFVVAWSW